MFPKFDDVPISTYLIVFAKMRRPSTTPSASTSRSLLEQDDVGGVLRDVGGRVDRDADVGVVQGERVVDAVAEERDRRTGATLRAQDPGLLLRAHAGEDRRRRPRGIERRRRPARRGRPR